jgi:hypothetical protein
MNQIDISKNTTTNWLGLLDYVTVPRHWLMELRGPSCAA